MEIIEKMVNMNELLHYTYIEEQKMFTYKSTLQHSNVYQIKEMLEIVAKIGGIRKASRLTSGRLAGHDSEG